MGVSLPKYVAMERTRGTVRYRFNYKGKKVTIPGQPGDAAFSEAHAGLMRNIGKMPVHEVGMRSAAVADDLISMAPPRKIACMLSNARLRAKKKGVPFDFSRDDLKAALSRQGWKCALSGLDLRFDGPGSDRRLVPSMDRIVPAKGYVRGNVRIVCHAVNIARHEWGDAGFLEICRAVVTKAEARQ